VTVGEFFDMDIDSELLAQVREYPRLLLLLLPTTFTPTTTAPTPTFINCPLSLASRCLVAVKHTILPHDEHFTNVFVVRSSSSCSSSSRLVVVVTVAVAY